MQSIGPQEVDDRCPGESSRGLERTGRGNDVALSADPAAELGREPRLPDAWLSAHHEQVGAAAPGPLPRLAKRGEFGPAADEGRFGDGGEVLDGGTCGAG